MEKTKIIVMLSETLHKQKVIQLSSLSADAFLDVKELIDLSFHENDQIGFRAAWILENIYVKDQERFIPHAAYFLSVFSNQDNLSCRRHFTKILALMTDKKSTQLMKDMLAKHGTGQLIETVFSWLIDPKVPVAIKAHCLDILANLSIENTWIKEELLQTIDFLIAKESIAFHGRAKKVKKQLQDIK